MCKLVEAYIKLFVQTRFHFTFLLKNIASMDKKIVKKQRILIFDLT